MAGNALRAVVIGLALLLAQAAGAGVGDDLRLAESNGGAELVSRDRAAEVAREATGGRVLKVELQRGDRPWYRVRVLVDGERVRSVAVDARTGRVRD